MESTNTAVSSIAPTIANKPTQTNGDRPIDHGKQANELAIQATNITIGSSALKRRQNVTVPE